MGSMREGLLEGGWSLKGTRGDEDGRADAERLCRLAGVIEGEIIPRLMMAHRSDGVRVPPCTPEDLDISPAQVQQFTELVLEDDIGQVRDYCTGLLREGAEPPVLLVGLLAPCARRLGEMWEDDEVDFTAVTVGLCRLQQVMREVSHACDYECDSDEVLGAPRVLLAPAPGEQHTFGMLMVAEFFRRAGWEVAGDCALSPVELRDMVARDWFAIVGLSAAYDTRLPELAEAIETLRQHSRNPDLQVLVGGRVFTENPALADQVGADATAPDAEGALVLAQEILVRKAVRA